MMCNESDRRTDTRPAQNHCKALSVTLQVETRTDGTLTIDAVGTFPEYGWGDDREYNATYGGMVICPYGRRLESVGVTGKKSKTERRLTSYAALNLRILTFSGFEYADRAYSKAPPPTIPTHVD